MEMKHLKLTAVLLWAGLLLMLTGTESLKQLLLYKELAFTFDPSPDFREFFRWADIQHIHSEWVLVKLGHFAGFAVLDLLLMFWLGRKLPALALSFLFALGTEVLQLFQNRDGRLYDVMIDTAGAFSAALLFICLHYILSKKRVSLPVSNGK
ncbi:VanZ family protein [Paenibacillus herberti]|uniref:VanZ-like domain-containing protein n=1 Tax=Paenibacillus herberti TaxID=1619309 RepID=A0A229P1F4_9BACL|nr:VanZ family protein [Paenibacillus herberti]OXM15774.1 hypothetical protein CGZ75_03375 [Paenibacillus herberti]